MTDALVVLATHNPRLDLLDRQLRSIRAQTVEDWQCLVFDDSSGDPRPVTHACAQDPRFRVMEPQPHLGHYRAFQHLLVGAAQADLPVLLCDQDDYWHPQKLERLLAVLRAGSTAAFSAMRVVDESGAVLRARFLPRLPDATALQPAELLLMNCVSGAALAIAPDVARAALPFPAPGLRGWHDQWLGAVAARVGRLAYLDEPLVDYTQHAGQVMGDGLRWVNRARLRAFVARSGSPRGVLGELRARTGWISTAAARLLELSDVPDPDLESLALGIWSTPLARQLWIGVRRGDVPLSRAGLLAAGFTVH